MQLEIQRKKTEEKKGKDEEFTYREVCRVDAGTDLANQ